MPQSWFRRDDGFGKTESASGKKNACEQAEFQTAPTDKGNDEIGSGAGHGHQRSALGILVRPGRIIGCTRPSDHPARGNIGQNRNDQHTPWLALNVWYRVQGNLSTQISRHITEPLSNQSMGRFVRAQGEQEISQASSRNRRDENVELSIARKRLEPQDIRAQPLIIGRRVILNRGNFDNFPRFFDLAKKSGEESADGDRRNRDEFPAGSEEN